MTNELIKAAVEKAEEYRVPAKEGPRPLRRMIDTATPYPVEALGSLLSAAALAIHDRVQAPIAICAQAVLATATLSTQGHANIVLPFGQGRPLSAFFITVAETGERKSSADKEAQRAIAEYEMKLRIRYEKERQAWENEHAAWKKQREIILGNKKQYPTRENKATALDALGREPREPLMPMLTCQEPSFEGLCKFLVNGQPSVGIFSGEGGQFIGGYGMGEDNRLKTAAGLCALWDGETLKRVRAGDGTVILADRRISLHLMAQPRVANQLLNDSLLIEQGLLSRVLIAAPDSTAGTRFSKVENPQTKTDLEKYWKRIGEILDAPLPLVEGKANELKPRELNLSPDAAKMWNAFADEIEGAIVQNGPLYPIKGLANKLPELAARLAGVLALIDDLARQDVPEEYLDKGIVLARYYANEAMRLRNVSALNQEILDAECLMQWIMAKWKEPLISLPDVYQFGPERFSTAEDARKAVKILEQHGWLEKLNESATVRGVTRREAWKIIRG